MVDQVSAASLGVNIPQGIIVRLVDHQTLPPAGLARHWTATRLDMAAQLAKRRYFRSVEGPLQPNINRINERVTTINVEVAMPFIERYTWHWQVEIPL